MEVGVREQIAMIVESYICGLSIEKRSLHTNPPVLRLSVTIICVYLVSVQMCVHVCRHVFISRMYVCCVQRKHVCLQLQVPF